MQEVEEEIGETISFEDFLDESKAYDIISVWVKWIKKKNKLVGLSSG